MKQQVFIISGGSTFDSYEAYLSHLRVKEVGLDRLRAGRWKINMSENLGDGYDVLLFNMPNSNNAKYLEWKIWFEKFIQLLDENIIFVGHSLGGIFLVKYLSEISYPKKIRATLLIAPPASAATEESLADFVTGEDLSKFNDQGGRITMYFSSDDQIVPVSHMVSYQRQLPSVEFKVFDGRGHFNQEQFPELVDDIKKLG